VLNIISGVIGNNYTHHIAMVKVNMLSNNFNMGIYSLNITLTHMPYRFEQCRYIIEEAKIKYTQRDSIYFRSI